MRFISHGDQEPQTLKEMPRKMKPGSPRDEWAKFDKAELRQALFALQYGRCAYCERNISRDNQNSCIEHVRPISRFPEKTFVWTNLVLSCKDPNTCNQHKKHVYPGADNQAGGPTWHFISPTEKRCESSFRYSRNGRVEPSNANEFETRNAEKTIELLNLNRYDLQNKRREVLGAIEHQIDALLAVADSSMAIKFLEEECRVDSAKPFYSAKRQCLKWGQFPI